MSLNVTTVHNHEGNYMYLKIEITPSNLILEEGK